MHPAVYIDRLIFRNSVRPCSCTITRCPILPALRWGGFGALLYHLKPLKSSVHQPFKQLDLKLKQAAGNFAAPYLYHIML